MELELIGGFHDKYGELATIITKFTAVQVKQIDPVDYYEG